MNEANFNERMDKMGKMMGQIIDMVAKNNEKLTAMEKRMGNMEKRMDNMDERLQGMDNRLERVESEQSKVSEKVGRIDDAFDQVNFDTLALNKRVFRTESEIERLAQQ